ncbi:DUF7210 family protein [Symbiobacterium terraclitae]|uniref:DUF7210 family protein n=1 Tax=Symbiobacterium terraclitae TaxID=557451 RepID=UPI0035B528D9
MAKRRQNQAPENLGEARLQRDEPVAVRVTWRVNVKHNTARFRAGETAEVAVHEIEELLRRGVIEPLEG